MGESKTVPVAGPTRKNNRKAQIVSAAERLLSERGLAAVTTRAIAEAVPCSEGAIYVHFPNRLELILTVFEQELAAMLTPLRALEEKVGTGTPRVNLTQAVTALQRFHGRVAPMLCSMFAEAELLEGFRRTLAARQKGPQGAMGRLASYIRAEQKLQRIAEEVDAEFVAAALMSGCFFAAFHRALLGQSLGALVADKLVAALVPEDKARAAT
jgi:AcrR family transcriptional regulator